MSLSSTANQQEQRKTDEEDSSFFYYEDLRAQQQQDLVRSPGSAIASSDGVRWMSIACAWGFSVRVPGDQFLTMDFLLASAKGALMAAHDFNTGNTAIVPQLAGATGAAQKCDIKLDLDFFDTYQDARQGATVIQKYIAPSKANNYMRKYAAVIGALRSTVSMPMAIVNRVHEIPQISHTSTSTDLNSRSTYSLFGRVIPSTDGDARAAIDYFQTRLKSTHLAILYVSEEYSSDYHRSLQQAARRANITVKSVAVRWQGGTRQEWLNRLTNVVDQLVQSGYQHFIGVIFQEQLGDLIDIGAAKGLFGPDRFWMFGDTITGDALLSFRYPPESLQAKALQGLALLSTGTSTVSGTYQRFVEQYNNLSNNTDFQQYFASKSPVSELVQFTANYSFGTPDHFTLLAYDAVMSLGLAACKSEQEFFNGTELFDQFVKTTFDGASGWVKINPATGSRDFRSMSYVIRNVQTTNDTTDGFTHIQIVPAAEYTSPPLKGTNITQVPAAEWLDVNGGFNFSDGTHIPPLSLPPFTPQDSSEFSVPLYSIFVAVGVLLMLTSVGLAVWTWCCRNSRVVKASQPGFLLLICAGAFFMAFSIVTRGATYPPMSLQWADFGCQAQYWFFSFGFSLAFSALFAKTWRVLRILGERVQRFHRMVVKPTDVLLPVVFFVTANLLILVVWQIVDPLHFVRKVDTDGSVDRFGRYTQTIAECSGEHGWSSYFVGALLVLNGCMVVAANIMAYKARHIRMEFSESNYIGLAMGIILQALFLALPVFMLETTPIVSLLASQILSFTIIASILSLLFLPKISAWRQYAKIKRQKLELRKARAVARRTEAAIAASMMTAEITAEETVRSLRCIDATRRSFNQPPSATSSVRSMDESEVEQGLLVLSVHGFDLESHQPRVNKPMTFADMSLAITQRSLLVGDQVQRIARNNSLGSSSRNRNSLYYSRQWSSGHLSVGTNLSQIQEADDDDNMEDEITSSADAEKDEAPLAPHHGRDHDAEEQSSEFVPEQGRDGMRPGDKRDIPTKREEVSVTGEDEIDKTSGEFIRDCGIRDSFAESAGEPEVKDSSIPATAIQ